MVYDDVINIYNEYINGKSILELSVYYNLARSTITRYFKKFNLLLKTKKQIIEEMVKKRNKTNLERYGVENPSQNKGIKEKVKKTNLEKYGVENPSQNKEIREKIKKTNLEKYGTEYVSQNRGIKEKVKETNLKRYGVENPSQNKEIREKIKKTNLKRYDSTTPLQNKEIREKIKKTNLERYGVENPAQNEKVKEKMKNTNFERYGTYHASKCKEIKEKIEQSFLEKYGVKHVLQNKEIKEKMKKTNLKRYGNECARKNEEINDKIKQTNLEKYGVENPAQNEKIKNKITQTKFEKYFKLLLEKIKNKYEFIDEYRGTHTKKDKWISYKFKCLKCNNIFETPIYLWQPKCPICYPPLVGKSKLEDEIEFFINSLGFKTQRNIRVLNKKEIDIYIPEKNIGIEINGIYYHNSNPESHSCKDKNYHKMKTDLAREKGIKLIHIWDCFNVEIYKSMIRNILGKTENKIYARKCQIKKITKEEEILFLEQNHIHGYTQSNKSLGLVYNDELVSLISFRKHKEGMEIARFASKLNTNVIGGFSRLLNHSDIKENIVTYCDIEFCPFLEDSVYYKNGFEFVKETSPKLYFTDFRQIYSRQEFMKYKLKDKLEKYDESLTAEENLFMNDIYPVYSTGNWKFILKDINLS